MRLLLAALAVVGLSVSVEVGQVEAVYTHCVTNEGPSTAYGYCNRGVYRTAAHCRHIDGIGSYWKEGSNSTAGRLSSAQCGFLYRPTSASYTRVVG
jgi:hypothetical protein